MEFMFSYHYNDYRDDKRKVYFQLGDIEYAASIINNFDFVDRVEIINEGVMMSIAIQQIPEIVCALAQKNVAVYSIITEKAL